MHFFAHTKARLRGVSARMDGLVGVFRTLASQHAEGIALARRITRDPDRREDEWPALERLLLAHERAEQRVVYAVLHEHDGVRELAEQHEVEATALEEHLSLIDDTFIGSDLWAARLAALIARLTAHAHEEEVEFFPQAIAAIGVEMAKSLDREYEDAYARHVECSPRQA